jgi:hypothetical protein
LTTENKTKDEIPKLITVHFWRVRYSGETGYKDIDLYDTSSIASDILGHQLIPHRNSKITLLGYNNTGL